MSTIKFTPLNAPSTHSQAQIQVDPLEAPFRECEKEYNLALRRDPSSAKETYVSLLRHDIIKNPLYQMENNGIKLSPRITRLKYCIMRNYAEILEEEYKTLKAKIAAQNAIEYYCRALNIDPSDYSIWLRVGRLAMSEELNDRELALYAFNQALKDFLNKTNRDGTRSEPIVTTPHHSQAFEELCRLLYDFGDFTACLSTVDKGLMIDPCNRILLQLRYQLLTDTWIRFSLPINYYDNATPVIQPVCSELIPRRVKSSGFYQLSKEKTDLTFNVKLNQVTWVGLGEALLHAFDVLMSDQNDLGNCDSMVKKNQRILIELQSCSYSNSTISNEVSGSSQKRKRKIEVATEAEDRSTNGRVNRWASKRTETIETFNRQRDEAASDFTDKIISLMAKFDSDYCLVNQQPDVEDQIEQFLRYFNKIWTFHVSNEDQGNLIDHVANKTGQKTTSDPRYYMFVPNTNPPPSSSYFNEISDTEGTLIPFVNKLNNHNSGIVDCLCKYITHLLGSFVNLDDGTEKSLWLCRWPGGLKEIAREILQRVDMDLLSILDSLCKNWDEKGNCAEMLMNINDGNIAKDYKQKMEILMAVYELLLDTQISWTWAPSIESSTHNSEISSGLQFTLTNYIDCFIRSSFYMSDFLTIAKSQAPTSGPDVEKWDYYYNKWKNWASQLSVRYWWCVARMEIWKGALDASINFLDTCKRTYLSGGYNDGIIIANCAYDAQINVPEIDRKIWTIQSRKNQPEDEWTRTIDNFADSIKFLYHWVSDTFDSDRVVLFWVTINTVNESLANVIELLSNQHPLAMLSTIDRKKFNPCFRLLFRISLEVLFPRSLVLKDAISDPLNILCVRTWVLFSYLLKEKMIDKLADDFAEFLEVVHDQLGERHICGMDNGIFLKFVITALQYLHLKDYRFQEYQCCHCLYRVSLTVDSTPPNDHQTPSVDLDHQTAQLLFREIRNYLNLKSRKSYKTWAIKNDVKETLDKMATLVAPPSENRFAQCSWKTQHFLDDDINFYDAVRYQEHSDDITDLEKISDQEPVARSDLSDLYYFRGKILLNQFKIRSKPNATKAMETLEKAIEQFTFDIRSNPLRFASWYALGICYANLANETLSWSAEEILNNRSKITEYQKKSFNCFLRGAKVIHWFSDRNASTPQFEVIRFWRDFGYQVYSMMTEPMSMEAFELSPIHAESRRKPTPDQACQFAAVCFGRALQLEVQLAQEHDEQQNDAENDTPMGTPNDIDTTPIQTPNGSTNESSNASTNGSAEKNIIRDWRIPYMIGKCYKKLKKSPEVVISLFKLAVERTPESSGITGQEKILDAEYKLTSSLAKYLITSKIKPSIVEKSIGVSLEMDNGVMDYTNEGDIFNIQKPEYQRAYNLICTKLENIRKADKNKWYHRPVFRQAWLTYHVEEKPEEAKTILQSLFQLKTHISKPMMNVWRPEFERAGRHYVYVHEYILLLIELAKKTGDLNMLETMEARLARSIVVLLKPDIIRIKMENATRDVEQAQQPKQQPMVSIELYSPVNDLFDVPANTEQARTPSTLEHQDIEGEPESSNHEQVSLPVNEHNSELSNVMSVAALISHDDLPMTIDFVKECDKDLANELIADQPMNEVHGE
ncbi:6271_t:CDS:2 [Acaulospora morrowiae]|uniref:6271_t:CDS:1 n=1 Tax=Acaulospora morrowiae TaxID=94023 RepID=A0A9N8YQ02_9GLOM|nr:6271_t:CDS:2 [Acaulospora morrowiae]